MIEEKIKELLLSIPTKDLVEQEPMLKELRNRMLGMPVGREYYDVLGWYIRLKLDYNKRLEK